MAMDTDAGEVAVNINIMETVIEAKVKAEITIMDEVANEAIMVADMVNNVKNGKIKEIKMISIMTLVAM